MGSHSRLTYLMNGVLLALAALAVIALAAGVSDAGSPQEASTALTTGAVLGALALVLLVVRLSVASLRLGHAATNEAYERLCGLPPGRSQDRVALG